MRVAGAQELMQLDVAVAGGGGGDIGFDTLLFLVLEDVQYSIIIVLYSPVILKWRV